MWQLRRRRKLPAAAMTAVKSSTGHLFLSTTCCFLDSHQKADPTCLCWQFKYSRRKREAIMVGTEFHDQAKGFADALLASRTATILDRISSRQIVELSSGDREVLQAAEELLTSCQAGHKVAEGRTEVEMGFLEWMEDLRHYENAFDAIVRSRLAEREADVTKTLDSAKSKVEKLLSGKLPKELNDVIQLFSSISEVNLDVAQDSSVLGLVRQ